MTYDYYSTENRAVKAIEFFLFKDWAVEPRESTDDHVIVRLGALMHKLPGQKAVLVCHTSFKVDYRAA